MRELRSNMTETERRLWRHLRRKQIGVKFRRQHPIGPYVADFACLSARLIVEIDGDTHLEAYDLHRDAWLETKRWRVMRVTLYEMDRDESEVVETICRELQQPGSWLRYSDREPGTAS